MSAAGPLDPDRLAAAEFSTAFRGYDTGEVRALLMTVGTALREAAEREHELREQLARAEHHLRELRETTAAQVEEAAEEARREGREMVAEAQRVRERMLGDLARRRRNARQQVEQLMAGRERLLEAFDSARQTIDAATQDMRGALPEARLAAEAAGRRFDQEVAGEDDEVAVAALEEEIEAARLVDLPLVADEQAPERAPADRTGAIEPSLLGERDARAMPAVELGADFEDVRIVPFDATDAAHAEVAEDAAHEAEPAADEPSTPEAVATDAAPEAGVGPEPGAERDSELMPEAESDPGADVDAASISSDPAAEAPSVDPEQIDDLFASLRAARESAVSSARSVLAHDDGVEGDVVAIDTEDVDTGEDREVVPAADVGDAGAAARDAETEMPSVSETVGHRDPGPQTDAPPAPQPTSDVDLTLAPVDVDVVITGAGEQLASGLKRVLADAQNELLDRLRHVVRGRRADDPGVLPDARDLVARFAAAARGPLTEVAVTAMASVGPDGRARPPAIDPLAEAAAIELAEALLERLERGFAEAGTDTAEASARARATFREWKTRRIGACAVDAARGAYHAGLLAGVGRSATLSWVLDDEGSACTECADNALAGPVTRGERYPTGHRHPPAHDGCRCTLVVTEEPSP